MESDLTRLIGIILIALMVGFFYRNAIRSILDTPKESFILAIPVIALGMMFYFFFKSKGF
jgi:hypothetical protein